jgi:hypothetical protein
VRREREERRENKERMNNLSIKKRRGKKVKSLSPLKISKSCI